MRRNILSKLESETLENDDCAIDCNETMQSTGITTSHSRTSIAVKHLREMHERNLGWSETDIKETCIDGGGPICRKIECCVTV